LYYFLVSQDGRKDGKKRKLEQFSNKVETYGDKYRFIRFLILSINS